MPTHTACCGLPAAATWSCTGDVDGYAYSEVMMEHGHVDHLRRRLPASVVCCRRARLAGLQEGRDVGPHLPGKRDGSWPCDPLLCAVLGLFCVLLGATVAAGRVADGECRSSGPSSRPINVPAAGSCPAGGGRGGAEGGGEPCHVHCERVAVSSEARLLASIQEGASGGPRWPQ